MTGGRKTQPANKMNDKLKEVCKKPVGLLNDVVRPEYWSMKLADKGSPGLNINLFAAQW